MINPLVFYLVDFLDSVGTLCCVIGAISALVVVIFEVFGAEELFDYDEKKAKKFYKNLAIVAVVCIVLALAIPSKEAMVEMLVAKYATAENAKAVVDYIVETWTRLK